MEYKVGDKVVFIDEEKHLEFPRYYPHVGAIGKIVRINGSLRVQWPRGTTSGIDVWLCNPKWVKPYKPQAEKLIIYRKDDETRCICITDGKRYETAAKCSPNDTYDFLRGAMIALGRMLEEV